MSTYTEATQLALSNLRSTDNFQWYLIPMLAFVMYVYTVEVERKNWNVVLAGLAFYGLEFFIEMLNGLFCHFTQYSALWTAPTDSAFLITVGLNIEISMMFAVAGIIFVKGLPADKKMKIFGLPNRWVFAIGMSIFCVLVEIVLNRWNALIWEYWFWNWYFPFLIIIIGYSLYMFFSAWVHDMESRSKQLKVVGTMWAVDVVCYAVFMGWLRWI